MQAQGDLLHTVTSDTITPGRRSMGRWLMWGSFGLFVAVVLVQTLYTRGAIGFGWENWRPAVYAYLFWGTMLCIGQVVTRGDQGRRALFVIPAVLFTVAMVVFPLLFGLTIAFSNWNLSSTAGRQFNGVDNIVRAWNDPFYRNALGNMVWYVLAISIEYVIAFGLALLLHAQIRARKFWRVAFLLPLMLSPVAVSWMIGRSMLEARFGPVARLMRDLGWENPSFFADPTLARAMIMMMDAWTWIPLMMVILLAGLQALDRQVLEAARVDGANGWQLFREVIFPLMLPVSITAILIRIIFKLKLADIIITVTAGGPGGATDSVTSFIFREYRDRSNVGYGTLLAMVYLVVIVIFILAFLKLVNRWLQRPM